MKLWNLKKNLFLRSWKVLYYKVRKVFLFHLSWKREKKTFFGQIGLEFPARQGQTVSKRIFKVESVERKSNFAYKNIFRQKYFWRKTIKLRAKDEKCTFLYTSEPSEFYLRRNQWVNAINFNHNRWYEDFIFYKSLDM